MKRPQETGSSLDTSWLSAECAQPGYEDLHDACRQTVDVPLPGCVGILLAHRCPCTCHAPDAGDAR
ncbi:hypothetical protein OG585_27505 [Streptomyces sp. NBC_01340]|uniref:hypothetical protein n=1 Tax=Streptomyces sp. NBC_01340 TaxID=2903830 RepID=UPI002E0F1704|nr:hypothetical protein OG585_27505 [Streptomyces sp. NBC_01340]